MRKFLAILKKLFFLTPFLIVLIYLIRGIFKHEDFLTYTQDLGLFDQVVWHLSHFQAPMSSIHPGNFFGEHFMPILYIFVPFYWIMADPKILIIGEILIFAIGAIPIYLIAKEKLNSRFAAVCFADAFLLFIGAQHALNYAFHTDALIAGFLPWIIYFLLHSRHRLYLLFIILMLFCKENASIYAIGIGIFALTFRQYRRIGFWTIILGGSWFYLTVMLLIPAINGGGHYNFFRYTGLGKDWGDAILNSIKDPIRVFNVLTNPHEKVKNMIFLFAGVGFLSIFSPRYMVLVLPMLAEKFLSDYFFLYGLIAHYSVAIGPVIILSAIQGVKNLSGILQNNFLLEQRTAMIFFSGGIILFTFGLTAYYRLPILEAPDLIRKYFKIAEIKNIDEAIRLVPQDASVTATGFIASHLARREKINQDIGRLGSDYVLLADGFGIWPYDIKEYPMIKNNLIQNNEYFIKFQKGNTILFERKR